MWKFILAFIVLVSLLSISMYSCTQQAQLAIQEYQAEHNRLVAQCVADGKKEYECERLVK